MIKEILMLLSFFVAGVLFMYLRGKIFNRVKKTTTQTPKLNASIGNQYTKDGKEAFQWSKVAQMFNLGSAVEWSKSIKEIIDLRKLTIYLVIGGILFAYAYWQGQSGKPIKVDLGYGKEAYIKLNGESLHIDKKGHVFVEDSKGKVLKQLTVKDIGGLRSKLAPYGFKLEPFVLAGGGYSSREGGGIEAGAGVSFIRVWKINLDAFLTNRGVYLGTSYSITNNSGIGIGAGKGWESDDRVIIYYKFRF